MGEVPAQKDAKAIRAFLGYFARSRSYDHDSLEVAGRPLSSVFLLLPEAGAPAGELLRKKNVLAELLCELAEPGEDLFLHSDRVTAEDAPPIAPEDFERQSDGDCFDSAVLPSRMDPQALRWRRLSEVIGQITAVARYSDDHEMMQAGPPSVPGPLCRVLSARRTIAEIQTALLRVAARKGARVEPALRPRFSASASVPSFKQRPPPRRPAMRIAKGCIVSLDYSVRLADGRLIETSSGKGPLEYLQGAGQILPALERALAGLDEGERRQFVFGPDEAFGERQPENVVTLPRSAFPPDVTVQVGARLSARNAAGQQFTLTVREVRGDQVVVDFNHPLAGETLVFDVAVRGVRFASQDEMFLGRAHTPAEA